MTQSDFVTQGEERAYNSECLDTRTSTRISSSSSSSSSRSTTNQKILRVVLIVEIYNRFIWVRMRSLWRFIRDSVRLVRLELGGTLSWSERRKIPWWNYFYEFEPHKAGEVKGEAYRMTMGGVRHRVSDLPGGCCSS